MTLLFRRLVVALKSEHVSASWLRDHQIRQSYPGVERATGEIQFPICKVQDEAAAWNRSRLKRKAS